MAMETQASGSASAGTSRGGISAEETNRVLRLGEHGLEVRDVRGRGRGLFGKKTYRPGKCHGLRSLLSPFKIKLSPSPSLITITMTISVSVTVTLPILT